MSAMPRTCLAVTLFAFAGCSPGGYAPTSTAQRPPAAQRSPAAQPAADRVSGTVLEAMDAAGYTYLRIKTAGGEVWAAVTQAAVGPGAEVTVGRGTWMEGFEGKTINRRFDRILFGELEAVVGGTSRPAAQSPQAAVQGAHAGLATGADPGEIKVAKAEGDAGRTVAEVYAGKADLKGKEVAVRGKVVKFNGGIMGRNWIHLRDGTGSREQQSDDLTVTTGDTVSVGDVVLVRGKLTLDRDFGAGYSYAVIVEEAKVTK
jgi:hypothetical protein